jgi:hypothetical protein
VPPRTAVKIQQQFLRAVKIQRGLLKAGSNLKKNEDPHKNYRQVLQFT